jgi:hypothetical protein
MHALLSLHVPVELEVPRGTYRLSHDADSRRADAPFDWPVTAAGEDLSRPADLPPKRGWKCFSNEPIASPVIAKYPTRGRRLTIAFQSEQPLAAYWGIWINSGGWAGHRHFALEPTTGRFDELDRAVGDGSAGCVAALGKTTWRVECTVGAQKEED